MTNVLTLQSAALKKYFLEEDSYFSFELPCYFTFNELLNTLSKELKGNNYKNFLEVNSKPDDYEGVNYKLLNNKDGEYAWRLFQLIHPVLYVSLVNEITKSQNWEFIKKRFEEFQANSCVECFSIPFVDKGKASKEKQISYWWKNIEQKSITLSLDFDYLFEVDIDSCYDSIYTHSIPWALHTKSVAKEKRSDMSLIGNVIDYHLRAMSNGQTNGIPQGSVLTDFIAEMLLGYGDELLCERLNFLKETDYKILRYRDDYRVFVNDPQKGKEIIKVLSEVISGFGMKLNAHKTRYSNDVILNALKPDKRYFMLNGIKSEKLIEELYQISDVARKHPNSGTVLIKLNDFYDRIKKEKKVRNTKVLISILVDIKFKNPRIYPIATAILSKLLSFLKKDEQKEVINQILKKFKKIPNTDHLEIWLQRITIKSDAEYDYANVLCERVKNKRTDEIWNSEWLVQNLKDMVANSEIIDRGKIDEIDSIIEPEEVTLFLKKQYNY